MTKAALPEGGKRAQRRAANRLRILQTATDHFFERGYAGATLGAVCDELRVTKPFIYWYFKDKQQILDTIAIEAAERIVSSLGEADDRDVETRLRQGLRNLVSNNVRNFKSGSFYYREPASLSPAARETVRSLAAGFHRELVELMEQAIAQGVIPRQDARLTALAVAGIVGFMYTWYRPGGRLPQEVVEARLLAVMLRAAGFRELEAPTI